MRSISERFAEPAQYRAASVVLLAVAFGLPIGIEGLSWPSWFGFAVGAPAYVALIILTYHRMRDAALSGGWIALMILVFNVGPAWEGPGSVTLHLGNLINVLPVFLGWIVPTNAGANPETVEVR